MLFVQVAGNTLETYHFASLIAGGYQSVTETAALVNLAPAYSSVTVTEV